MWLAVDIGIVLLGLVLLALTGWRAWSRFRRMTRAGQRMGRRVGELGDQAADLAERMATLEQATQQQADRLRDVSRRPGGPARNDRPAGGPGVRWAPGAGQTPKEPSWVSSAPGTS